MWINVVENSASQCALQLELQLSKKVLVLIKLKMKLLHDDEPQLIV
jgi:hypothetical protein